MNYSMLEVAGKLTGIERIHCMHWSTIRTQEKPGCRIRPEAHLAKHLLLTVTNQVLLSPPLLLLSNNWYSAAGIQTILYWVYRFNSGTRSISFDQVLMWYISKPEVNATNFPHLKIFVYSPHS